MITVGIPTKERPRALARLLASLHAQTTKDFEVVIVRDGPYERCFDETCEFFVESLLRCGVDVEIAEGPRINQAYCHNHVLWRGRSSKLILRCDDDMVLTPSYIATLLNAWFVITENQGVDNLGALSGTIFTDHIHPRDDYPPTEDVLPDHFRVGVQGELLNATPFMQEYSGAFCIETEHLYSSFLYDRDAMRKAGGFPVIYSKGVGYHEETDACVRLKQSGCRMFLVPVAKAYHSHESVGGTRFISPAEHGRRRESDWKRFLLRLGQLRGIPSFTPSVAVCSQHCSGVGGAQRLTYGLVEVLLGLKSDGFLGEVGLIPLNNETVETREFVKDNYSLDVSEEALGPFDEGRVWDVVISIGHVPPDPAEIPDRRHHIHYSLFPMILEGVPKRVDRFVAISEFSSDYVRQRYFRGCEAIYPFVEYSGVDPSEIEKKNTILIVGRTDKSVSELAGGFLMMDSLPEDTELHIVANKVGENFPSYLFDHDRIFLHQGLTNDELDSLYLQAKVLWAGRGFSESLTRPEGQSEHFGYTPVEAIYRYCIPLSFDAGGYRETTTYRWTSLEQLEKDTCSLLSDRDRWEAGIRESWSRLSNFSRESFELGWLRVIASTNTFAWESEVEWRVAEEPQETSIEDGGGHVVVISDHPEAHRGFAVVCREVCDGLTESGFQVHVLGINGIPPNTDGKYASLWPSPDGVPFDKVMKEMAKKVSPSAIVVMYDPHNGSKMVNHAASAFGQHVPIVSFVSQEGIPAHPSWRNILAKSRFCITYCQSAADDIMMRYGGDVDWVYLGADHANFRRYGPDTVRAMRSMLDIDDKFVMFSVFTNKRYKAPWKSIQVAKILTNKYGYSDIKLILHTDPRPGTEFSGIDIEMYARQLGIWGDDPVSNILKISYPALMKIEVDGDTDALIREQYPRNNRDRAIWFSRLSMIDRYNLSDLYLDLSGMEGFGLPLMEAIACGIPAMSLKDGFVREEIFGDHPGLIPTHPIDVFVTGSNLAVVDPEVVAERVHRYRESGVGAITKDNIPDTVVELRWDTVREKIVEAVRKCLT